MCVPLLVLDLCFLCLCGINDLISVKEHLSINVSTHTPGGFN